MKVRSLQMRLVMAAAAWTTAVVLLAFVVAFITVRTHPRLGSLVHSSLMLVMGAAFTTAGILVIRRGLSPLTTLRERLAEVRSGHAPQIEGEYPSEVMPLVEDLNTLLADRERRVARAVGRAGDLAHGLKTPLAVLTQEIDRVDAVGQNELAVSMREQVARMRRQVDSHLAQARASAGGATANARADLASAARGLARTMARLYAERALAIDVDQVSQQSVRVPTEDLEEMLGNLLDNACKWARSRVVVSSHGGDQRIVIDVDDDGPGLEPSMRERVLQRGVRADEAAPGSGLGLAIVQELAHGYGGSIALDRSPDGGLRARLTLPA